MIDYSFRSSGVLIFIMSTEAIHSSRIYPFMELIIIKKNTLNIMYISWLIGAEDAFTVSGLNCDPGIFRENNL